jgi:hypothetical protein
LTLVGIQPFKLFPLRRLDSIATNAARLRDFNYATTNCPSKLLFPLLD